MAYMQFNFNITLHKFTDKKHNPFVLPSDNNLILTFCCVTKNVSMREAAHTGTADFCSGQSINVSNLTETL